MAGANRGHIKAVSLDLAGGAGAEHGTGRGFGELRNYCDHLAVAQNQWYHCGVGAPPNLVYFSWDWDVHCGYGVFTHSHFDFDDS